VLDGETRALAPGEPRLRSAVARFPALAVLDLSACRDVRTSAVTRSLGSGPIAVRLASLAIGTAPGEWAASRLSNAVSAALAARLQGLTSLSLASDALTGERGLAPLAGLTGLRVLALDCRRTTDKAVAALVGALPRLEAFSASTAGDRTLAALAARPSSLTALRLATPASTAVAVAALASLAASPGGVALRSLALVSASQVGPATLAGFSALTHLALPYSVSVAASSLARLRHLRLESLDVRHCTSFDDAGVRTVVAAWGGSLASLRMEGTRATVAASPALASLASLRSLSLGAHNRCRREGVLSARGDALAAPWCGAGGGLTRLAVWGVETPPGTWAGLPTAFPGLVDLTITERAAWSPAAPLSFPTGVLSRLTALQALELSAACVGSGGPVVRLVGALPRLETLVLPNALSYRGLPGGGLAGLSAACPAVDVRKARARVPGGWVDAVGGAW
jgi:hypothetical protein